MSGDPEKMQAAQAMLMKYQQYLTYYKEALNNSENSIKIVGIVRLNDNAKTGSLKAGIVYRNELTDSMIDYHNNSEAMGSIYLDKFLLSIEKEERIIKNWEERKYNDWRD